MRINGRRYVCCSECYVVSNECDETNPCLVRPICVNGGKVMYIWIFCFRGELGFLNSYDICMCVVNKQLDLLKNPLSLTTAATQQTFPQTPTLSLQQT